MKKAVPVLGTIVLVLGICLPTLGRADMTLVDPRGNEIRLLESPCESKAGALATMPDAARANAKAGWIKYEGKVYSACYVLRGRWGLGQVMIVDEEGDAGVMPAELFKVVTSI